MGSVCQHRLATHLEETARPIVQQQIICSSRNLSVLLSVHILCSVITEFDPKKRNVGSKIYHLILCICPVVSLWCGVMIYGNALGYKDVINLNLWTNVLLGIVLIVVGNYLPKCRQNYMIGIKLPWTLDNEENWDYTHRMAGNGGSSVEFDDSAWISEVC